MIPVADSPRARTFPLVNSALIVANLIVFFFELTLSPLPETRQGLSELERFFLDWGVVPLRFSNYLEDPSRGQAEILFRPVSAMFIQGGWLHLFGNMLFLWVFGDNVEDRMGHVKYALFYFLTGYIATLAHVYADPESPIPAVGASGAISGVLGAYLVLYPRALVTVLIPFFFFIPTYVPAFVLIGFWFVIQLFSGVAALDASTAVTEGVAYWAHIGGFAAGLVLVLLLRSLPGWRAYPGLTGGGSGHRGRYRAREDGLPFGTGKPHGGAHRHRRDL